MKRSLGVVLLAARLMAPGQVVAGPMQVDAIVHAQPLHAGRVNPRLSGNFVELLDDVVPGLWAEMLNDRSFEGVKRMIDPVYYDGSPDFCDREWDRNPTWWSTATATRGPDGGRSARPTGIPPLTALGTGRLAMKSVATIRIISPSLERSWP